MDAKQKWAKLFEEVNGRKASPEEYMAAKEKDFDPAELERLLPAQAPEEAGSVFASSDDLKKSEKESLTIPDNSISDLGERWANFFMEVHGCEPSPEEYLEAKASGFDMSVLEAMAAQKLADENILATARDKWLSAFEKKYQRDPENWEFARAEAENFNLLTLADATEPTNLGLDDGDFDENHYDQSIENLTDSDYFTQDATDDRQHDDYYDDEYLAEEDEEWYGQPREKVKKAKVIAIVSASVLALLVASAAALNFTYFSEAAQLNRYVLNYNANKGDISKNLDEYVWADSKKPVTKKDLQLMGDVSDKIYSNKILPGTSFKEAGKQFLIFPKYKVFVEPQSLDIKANAAGLDFKINNHGVGKSTSSSYSQSLGHLFPAKYEIQASGEVSHQAINLNKQVDLTSGKATANFGMEFINFHLYSNLKDGDVYVGKSKIGSLSEAGDYKFINVPVLKGEELFVEKKFKDGTAKSKQLAVDEIQDGSSVYLNWPQVLDIKAADGLMKSAVNTFSHYANNGEVTSDVDQVFAGGSDNLFFKMIAENINHSLKPSDNNVQAAENIRFDNMSVTHIEQTGINTYEVSFNLRWIYHYSENSQGAPEQGFNGDSYQTGHYKTLVKYEPSDKAEAENKAALNTTDRDNTTSSGSGGDAKNFQITDIVGKQTADPVDTSQLKSYDKAEEARKKAEAKRKAEEAKAAAEEKAKAEAKAEAEAKAAAKKAAESSTKPSQSESTSSSSDSSANSDSNSDSTSSSSSSSSEK